MKYNSRVQVITRSNGKQWYVYIPVAVAQAMELNKGETVLWFIDNHQRLLMIRGDTSGASVKIALEEKITDEKVRLSDELDKLFLKVGDAFDSPAAAARARELAYGNLTCLGRHTITGMLTATGQQFRDWTEAYRLFSKSQIDFEKIYNIIIRSTLEELPTKGMIIAHMDDTIIKKTGKKIPGTAWRRDPLGPPFQINLAWSQRFLEVSLALPAQEGPCQSRSIPIAFQHIPTVKKPSCKDKDSTEMRVYREEQKQAKLSQKGIEQIQATRVKLDQQGYADRTLYVGVDGSYTNSTVFKNLPKGVAAIGRMRKDAGLYMVAKQPDSSEKGRKKIYGDSLPTPEQIRQSDVYKWQTVKAWGAGKEHEFKVKIVKDVKWRPAGEAHTMQLMVVEPLAYRLNKNSKILYREPAYFICTDNNLSAQELLQAYLWRWEIEVNFRDEKTLLGCGQSQVRNPASVANVPAFVVAMYSFLLLAGHKAFKNKNRKHLLPRAKWHPASEEDRITTGDLINQLRAEWWTKGSRKDFSAFVDKEHETKSRRHRADEFSSAAFYSRK